MRTIIVGDVHGCRIELEALLDRVAFSSGDRLVFVGDLVARGPDSLGVLDVVRRTGAIVVRGNHEQRLLDWREARRLLRAARASGVTGRSEPSERTDRNARVETQKPLLGKVHRDLARALRPIDWTLLETASIWVDLPEHGARIVHAGVLPGVSIEAHHPDTLMRLRTVRIGAGFGKGPALGGRKNVLWGACYAGPPHVVFGHNAAPGLQLHPWATGLDTGCVYGGRLTAMVLAEGQRIPRAIHARRALLCSEPARRVWYQPERREAEARRQVA